MLLLELSGVAEQFLNPWIVRVRCLRRLLYKDVLFLVILVLVTVVRLNKTARLARLFRLERVGARLWWNLNHIAVWLCTATSYWWSFSVFHAHFMVFILVHGTTVLRCFLGLFSCEKFGLLRLELSNHHHVTSRLRLA